MPAEETSRWQSPFWLGATGNAVGALIAIVVVGIVGRLAKVSVPDLLLYGGVPTLVLILLVVGVRVGRAVLLTVRRWEVWKNEVSDAVMALWQQVRRLYLHDVIHTARVLGWKVSDDDDHDLAFHSPDADEVYVTGFNPDPEEVAKQLHNAAPSHFPEKWEPFVAKIGGDTLLAGKGVVDLGKQLAALENRLDDVFRARANLPRELMQLRLADIAHEAREHGWIVEWDKDKVVFTKHGEKDVGISYGNAAGVDLDKVRIVLGFPGRDRA